MGCAFFFFSESPYQFFWKMFGKSVALIKDNSNYQNKAIPENISNDIFEQICHYEQRFPVNNNVGR